MRPFSLLISCSQFLNFIFICTLSNAAKNITIKSEVFTSIFIWRFYSSVLYSIICFNKTPSCSPSCLGSKNNCEWSLVATVMLSCVRSSTVVNSYSTPSRCSAFKFTKHIEWNLMCFFVVLMREILVYQYK